MKLCKKPIIKAPTTPSQRPVDILVIGQALKEDLVRYSTPFHAPYIILSRDVSLLKSDFSIQLEFLPKQVGLLGLFS